MRYIKLRTKNAAMMRMYGDKLTWSEKAREMRTNGLHTEIQFSDRYGNISFSSTLSDGCNGCRFKMIDYSHPYRWSTVLIPVTAELEARLFKKACEMANMDNFYMRQESLNGGTCGCYYNKHHIKYDKGAAFFSFISKHNIWKPSKTKMICNRACAVLLLEVWPDMLDVKPDRSVSGNKIIDPAQITPEQLHYMVEFYNERKEQ